MAESWEYADSALAQSSVGIGLPNVRAPRRSLEALFLRPLFSMVGGTAGASARRFPLTPVDQPSVARHPSIGLDGGGSLNQSEGYIMPTVTPLHPANAARAQSLVASVSESPHQIDLDAVVQELPEFLGTVLALILEDFDYDRHPRCSLAVAVRILAAMAARFEEALT